jgi:hypothetical protein
MSRALVFNTKEREFLSFSGASKSFIENDRSLNYELHAQPEIASLPAVGFGILDQGMNAFFLELPGGKTSVSVKVLPDLRIPDLAEGTTSLPLTGSNRLFLPEARIVPPDLSVKMPDKCIKRMVR